MSKRPQQQQSRWKHHAYTRYAETQHEFEIPLGPMPEFVFLSHISLSEDFRRRTGGFGLTSVSHSVFWTLLPSFREMVLVEPWRKVLRAPAIGESCFYGKQILSLKPKELHQWSKWKLIDLNCNHILKILSRWRYSRSLHSVLLQQPPAGLPVATFPLRCTFDIFKLSTVSWRDFKRLGELLMLSSKSESLQ